MNAKSAFRYCLLVLFLAMPSHCQTVSDAGSCVMAIHGWQADPWPHPVTSNIGGFQASQTDYIGSGYTLASQTSDTVVAPNSVAATGSGRIQFSFPAGID